METFASAVSFSIWPVPVGYLLPCPSTRSGESQSVEEAVLRLLRINCSLTAVPVSFFHVTKNHRRQEGTIHSAQSVVYPEMKNKESLSGMGGGYRCTTPARTFSLPSTASAGYVRSNSVLIGRHGSTA